MKFLSMIESQLVLIHMSNRDKIGLSGQGLAMEFNVKVSEMCKDFGNKFKRGLIHCNCSFRNNTGRSMVECFLKFN